MQEQSSHFQTDYYGTLQVSAAAEQEVIQAAYDRLVEKWLAQRKPGDPTAFQRMAMLDEALSVLSDPQKRQEYDLLRSQDAPRVLASTPPAQTPSPQASSQPRTTPGKGTSTSAVAVAHSIAGPAVWGFAAVGASLFLFEHSRSWTSYPGLFLLTCFTWLVAFGVPARICFRSRLRNGATIVAVLFFLAATLEVVASYFSRKATLPPTQQLGELSFEEQPTPAALGRAPETVMENPLELAKRFPVGKPAPDLSNPLELAKYLPFGSFIPSETEGVPGESPKAFLKRNLKNEVTWEAVAPKLRKARINPEQYRQAYQLEEARMLQKGESSRVERFALSCIPFVSRWIDLTSKRAYWDSVERFKEGKATQADAATIARYERVMSAIRLR